MRNSILKIQKWSWFNKCKKSQWSREFYSSTCLNKFNRGRTRMTTEPRRRAWFRRGFQALTPPVLNWSGVQSTRNDLGRGRLGVVPSHDVWNLPLEEKCKRHEKLRDAVSIQEKAAASVHIEMAKREQDKRHINERVSCIPPSFLKFLEGSDQLVEQVLHHSTHKTDPIVELERFGQL